MGSVKQEPRTASVSLGRVSKRCLFVEELAAGPAKLKSFLMVTDCEPSDQRAADSRHVTSCLKQQGAGNWKVWKVLRDDSWCSCSRPAELPSYVFVPVDRGRREKLQVLYLMARGETLASSFLPGSAEGLEGLDHDKGSAPARLVRVARTEDRQDRGCCRGQSLDQSMRSAPP